MIIARSRSGKQLGAWEGMRYWLPFLGWQLCEFLIQKRDRAIGNSCTRYHTGDHCFDLVFWRRLADRSGIEFTSDRRKALDYRCNRCCRLGGGKHQRHFFATVILLVRRQHPLYASAGAADDLFGIVSVDSQAANQGSNLARRHHRRRYMFLVGRRVGNFRRLSVDVCDSQSDPDDRDLAVDT